MRNVLIRGQLVGVTPLYVTRRAVSVSNLRHVISSHWVGRVLHHSSTEDVETDLGGPCKNARGGRVLGFKKQNRFGEQGAFEEDTELESCCIHRVAVRA